VVTQIMGIMQFEDWVVALFTTPYPPLSAARDVEEVVCYLCKTSMNICSHGKHPKSFGGMVVESLFDCEERIDLCQGLGLML
jgi:hypothetical protein